METDAIDSSKKDVEDIPQKPLKPEDKPFQEFVTQDLIPRISQACEALGVNHSKLLLQHGIRPVVGGNCWMLYGELPQGRRYWVCFSNEKITSSKTISLAEAGSEPSLLESFLIDEKKISMSLLVSRLLQRLNGQKWLGSN